MRDTIIGTGFFATHSTLKEKTDFLNRWMINTAYPSHKIIIFDNSETGLLEDMFFGSSRVVRSNFNLGHCSDIESKHHKFTGWSMSWIIPALIAYSDNCDFVYKEQDCLAFGDWMRAIKIGKASFGTHDTMDCENSLFYIERDFIPEFVQVYMSLPQPDHQCLVETKFAMTEGFFGDKVFRHELGVGRNRPLPEDLKSQPWYAQKLTELELDRIATEGLI